MFNQKIFFWAFQFFLYIGEAFRKDCCVGEQWFISKPKCTTVWWYYLDNFSAESYLDALYRWKNEGTQFFVKIIQGYYVLKLAFRLKYMVHFIAFHRFPIISQTKITNDFQAFNCRLLIIKQKSPVFQHFHLVDNTYGLLSICFHRCIKNKFRPGTHCKEAWRKLLLQR